MSSRINTHRPTFPTVVSKMAVLMLGAGAVSAAVPADSPLRRMPQVVDRAADTLPQAELIGGVSAEAAEDSSYE